MKRLAGTLLLVPVLATACVGGSDRRTLSDLHSVEPDLAEVQLDDGLDKAMHGYRKFLEEAPKSALTPEAMRRLADLKLEREYGFVGGTAPAAMPAHAPTSLSPERRAAGSGAASTAIDAVSDAEFEQRASASQMISSTKRDPDIELPGQQQVEESGPLEAIELYNQILATYPNYQNNDWVLYQKARAFDELARPDEAITVVEELIQRYPHSRHVDEAQFRRAEYFFTRKKFLDAEEAYQAIARKGAISEYYELALYKLGWSLYKQEMHEEALDQYVTLLDYKVATGYDFDQASDEMEERRISDTYRVISLSFSSLGGPDVVNGYFARNGRRSYEDRIYSQLGEFYLEKLRYSDAAMVYKSFVDLHPLHAKSPRFSMRVIEIYEAGGFPKLVLEGKKEFAKRYGLQSGYWAYFDVAESGEVLADLKSNLGDLATHYHALYQEKARAEERPENFQEAHHWYHAYLESFPSDPETPEIHYQLADLLLEHEDFAAAAREYERTAYGYQQHERASSAGYAAIFAHRENEQRAPVEQREPATRKAVESSIRFVEAFPAHEHAAVVLGAAADDLYDLKELDRAAATARRLIEAYPGSELAVRRSAWAVIAHSSFDLADYVGAEQAYTRVLELTVEEDDSRQAVVDSLAASIYKQGEQATAALDHRAAADHYLRVALSAPTSDIRPIAEYDAGAALIQLEDWAGAAEVFGAFRVSHPAHELSSQATQQMAFVYRKQGDHGRAADEYERVAAEAGNEELEREALLLAGELHEEAGALDRALAVYERFVAAFPTPLDVAVETRFEIAGIHKKLQDEDARKAELRRIVKIDRDAGADRTPRVRYLAAQSALLLSRDSFDRFIEVKLTLPFEKSLEKKQARMDVALKRLGDLLDYEVAEVTAAATFYLAEVYFDFSQTLMASERPAGLDESQELEYEMALEEEAFPFEEQAIEVHEKNLELLSVGVFNAWVERSLEKLAEVMPGRYAKFESGGGWMKALDQYAYLAPSTSLQSAGTEPASTQPDVEVPVEAASIEVAETASSAETSSPAVEPVVSEVTPEPVIEAKPDPVPASISEASPEDVFEVAPESKPAELLEAPPAAVQGDHEVTDERG
jgi:TolA-binding protein